jgi:hypothetical protein
VNFAPVYPEKMRLQALNKLFSRFLRIAQNRAIREQAISPLVRLSSGILSLYATQVKENRL